MFSKVAVFSVVYPGVEPFAADFFAAVARQGYRNFDLVIVNDGMVGFNEVAKRFFDGVLIELAGQGSPILNRAKGFDFLCQQQYTHVILMDADDFDMPNRVERALSWLERYDIVVNDFDIIDDKSQVTTKGYLSKRLAHQTEIGFDFLKDKNIFGFGNTSMRGDLLKDCRFHEKVRAADWYLFSCLLKQGARAVFISDTVTYHRLHGANILSLDEINQKAFARGLEIKIEYLEQMALLDQGYRQSLTHFVELKNDLLRTGLWQQHIDQLKEKIQRPAFWLEEIQ